MLNGCRFFNLDSLFEKLYAGYKHQVFFFVKKYVHGQDDIEDIVQDIFVHLWKHRDALGSNTDAIVYKTAKQEIANFYRKNKLSFTGLDENGIPDTEKEEYDEEESRKHLEQIESLLDQVPEKSKSFFLQHKIGGQSYSQIAEENHISKNAVAKHVNKVLNLIKTHLHFFFL
ncbi:sigma-70 family RNA polymerase sigma factor [Chryseobacterium sp.]|jgi:RNA polymerase sigma-70 factor (ECF subfamily)|uniref:RNA polymerase sigma factor n=1 Tax=Chryseobacterium sp. TaxID=1871047 RepID=UPI0028524BF7|nr:sigma-70 family RNA polymerase sigma factor [Chryseobacterium sp.]